MKIQITVYGGNLVPSHPENMDIEASQDRYVEMLEERIQAAYPDAEVSIELERNTEGSPPPYFIETDTDTDTFGYEDQEEIVARIDQIKEGLGDEWIVGRRP